MKHTKGPWTLIDVKKLLGKAHCQDYDFQVSSKGLWICNISNHIKKHKANAKLISKAPIFYEYIKKKAKEGCPEANKILSSL